MVLACTVLCLGVLHVCVLYSPAMAHLTFKSVKKKVTEVEYQSEGGSPLTPHTHTPHSMLTPHPPHMPHTCIQGAVTGSGCILAGCTCNS